MYSAYALGQALSAIACLSFDFSTIRQVYSSSSSPSSGKCFCATQECATQDRQSHVNNSNPQACFEQLTQLTSLSFSSNSLNSNLSPPVSLNSHLSPPVCQLKSRSAALSTHISLSVSSSIFFHSFNRHTDVGGHITEFSFLTFLPLVYLLLRAVFLTMSTSPLPSVSPEPSFDTLQSMYVEQVCALTYATLKKIFLGAPDDWKAEHSNIPRRVYQLLGIVLSFREKIRICNEHENPEQREANGRHQLEKLMS